MTQAEQQRMLYFAMMTEAEQREAIKRLADSGVGDHGIASATGIAVEAVRSIIGQRATQCQSCTQ